MSKRGFTLLELIIVIVILIILAKLIISGVEAARNNHHQNPTNDASQKNVPPHLREIFEVSPVTSSLENPR